MKNLSLNIRLLIVFGILLIGAFASESFFRRPHDLPYKDLMVQSVELTKKWFSIIELVKKEKGVESDAGSIVPYHCMIGNEWTAITTSLGSLESKEVSTNPDFSALIVRLLKEANIKKGDKVGVALSGSFPSLAISVLAALQTLEVDAVIASSIGASTYGANQPEVTWIDMESNLRKRGGLKFASSIISMGAYEDAGKDLSDEGISIIQNAAIRNNVNLYLPKSLNESIEKRMSIFNEAHISLLINIGGNQTSLGGCAHSIMIPNGLHFKLEGCNDKNRGVITRINESGIPFINLLDIKDLASRYGMALSPGVNYSKSTQLYSTTSTNKMAIGIITIICFFPLCFLRRKF
jgi:poly-gamma-glutamate system protein